MLKNSASQILAGILPAEELVAASSVDGLRSAVVLNPHVAEAGSSSQ